MAVVAAVVAAAGVVVQPPREALVRLYRPEHGRLIRRAWLALPS